MAFRKSKSFCNQASELIKVNERIQQYYVALKELELILQPYYLLSENEKRISLIVSKALHGDEK